MDLATAAPFVDDLLARLAARGVDVSGYEIDHICWRTASRASYDAVKAALIPHARLLTEADVRGRPIATFLLREPIRAGGRVISLLEVPAPKPGAAYAEGWEHAEIVVGQELASLRARHPTLPFDTSGLAHAGNPELALPLGDGRTVKFHPESLLTVIQRERLQDVEHTDWSDPASSLRFHPERRRLLAAWEEAALAIPLARFAPTLVGTFPLALDVDGSDFDVLCDARRLDDFEATVYRAFAGRPGFSVKRGASRGVPFVKASYTAGGVPVEIFGQERRPRDQDAFMHLLVEAKLIALTGAWATAALRDLKRAGAKTEPAFAAFFGLSGDPYLALLDLAKGPEDALAKLATRRLATL